MPEPGVTTDLGLGQKLSDPEAPKTWHYRIYRQGSMARAGFSTATHYQHAAEAAKDILREYLVVSGVPISIRRRYTCDVAKVVPDGAQAEIGSAVGKDIR